MNQYCTHKDTVKMCYFNKYLTLFVLIWQRKAIYYTFRKNGSCLHISLYSANKKY